MPPPFPPHIQGQAATSGGGGGGVPSILASAASPAANPRRATTAVLLATTQAAARPTELKASAIEPELGKSSLPAELIHPGSTAEQQASLEQLSLDQWLIAPIWRRRMQGCGRSGPCPRIQGRGWVTCRSGIKGAHRYRQWEVLKRTDRKGMNRARRPRRRPAGHPALHASGAAAPQRLGSAVAAPAALLVLTTAQQIVKLPELLLALALIPAVRGRALGAWVGSRGSGGGSGHRQGSTGSMRSTGSERRHQGSAAAPTHLRSSSSTSMSTAPAGSALALPPTAARDCRFLSAFSAATSTRPQQMNARAAPSCWASFSGRLIPWGAAAACKIVTAGFGVGVGRDVRLVRARPCPCPPRCLGGCTPWQCAAHL